MNAPAPAGAFAHAKNPTAVLIPLKAILIREQIRKEFAPEELQELADSIKVDGLIQPVVVRKVKGPEASERFELVAGERRCRAAKLAGLEAIRAEVHEGLDDAGVQVLQLVENVQRVDLSLSEQCDGVAALVKQLEGVEAKTGLQNAAAKLGKSLAWVSRRAGLVSAPPEVKKLIKTGKLTDVEIASGLAELQQVAPKKDFQDVIDMVANPNPYDQPIDREYIREQVRDAKEAIKQKAKAAADRKAGKKKPLNEWEKRQAAERAEQERKRERWKVIGPIGDAFAKNAKAVLGFSVRAPHYDGYYPPPAPASLETMEFILEISGSAQDVKEAVSKSGVTVKLDMPWGIAGLTPDQALKIEQVVGRKLRWSDHSKLKGKQLAALAARAGKKLELSEFPKAPAPAAKSPAKPVKKKH